MHRKALLTLLSTIVVLTGCTHTNLAVANNSGDTVAVERKAFTGSDDDKERKSGHGVAYFAAGCFWGVEDGFKSIKGVLDTTVGYTGGVTENPSYQDVCGHDTKHAEAVRVVFDPKQVSFKDLLGDFLDMHDPTTLNRQGPDYGDQYRSAIFYTDDNQLAESKAAISSYQASGKASGKIVTSLEKFGTFYSAEDYHQDYFAKHGGGSCHVRKK